MSEQHPLTPPGWLPPPGSPPPSDGADAGWWGPPGQPVPTAPQGAGWGAPPGYAPPLWAPVHKPGIVALRPLGIGDLYDGAFKSIRQNPKVMIGMSIVLVTAFLLLPSLVSVLLAVTGDLAGPFSASDLTDPAAESDPAQGAGAMVMSYAGQLMAVLAGLALTGLVVHVVAEAVLGRRTTFGQAWTAVRGRLLRLVGLTALAVLTAVVVIAAAVVLIALASLAGTAPAVVTGVVTVPLALALLVWLQVRLFLLAPPALVLERRGVFASMRRSYALTKRQFWRTFGIYLLTSVMVGVVASMLAIPFTVVSLLGIFLVPEAWAGLVYVLMTYLGLVLTQALTTPFTAAVVALQYVDQRIRKEGFDIELLSSAQPGPPTHHTG